jgi:hypothetical protein
LEVVFSWRNEAIAFAAEPLVKGSFADEVRANDAYALALKEMSCSQTTVGALAPLMETLIRSAIRRRRKNKHLVPINGNGPFRQLQSLLEPLATSPDMLDVSWVQALFAYRDAALHNGYEWPEEARQEFAEMITNKSWNPWFNIWLSDETPLFIAMRDAFVHNALQQMQAIASALRKAEEKLN